MLNKHNLATYLYNKSSIPKIIIAIIINHEISG